MPYTGGVHAGNSDDSILFVSRDGLPLAPLSRALALFLPLTSTRTHSSKRTHSSLGSLSTTKISLALSLSRARVCARSLSLLSLALSLSRSLALSLLALARALFLSGHRGAPAGGEGGVGSP
jgi:hypothetical protein